MCIVILWCVCFLYTSSITRTRVYWKRWKAGVNRHRHCLFLDRMLLVVWDAVRHNSSKAGWVSQESRHWTGWLLSRQWKCAILGECIFQCFGINSSFKNVEVGQCSWLNFKIVQKISLVTQVILVWLCSSDALYEMKRLTHPVIKVLH